MKEKTWWTPDELAITERKFRSIKNISEIDTKNDFGSYRKMLLTGDKSASEIKSHNDINPIRKIQLIKKRLKLSNSNHILDAGCGLGYTTTALANTFVKSKVTGIDISEDAIEYAKQNFHNAEFKSLAISPSSEKIGKFDCIFCFEFYPFTRNKDSSLQSKFLEYFSAQLNPLGTIVIYQAWNNPNSLVAILDEVKSLCPNLHFCIYTIPHPKLPTWLPFWTATIISHLLCFLGLDGLKRIIAIKNRNPTKNRE